VIPPKRSAGHSQQLAEARAKSSKMAHISIAKAQEDDSLTTEKLEIAERKITLLELCVKKLVLQFDEASEALNLQVHYSAELSAALVAEKAQCQELYHSLQVEQCA
jgi:hypothetical protein